MTGLGNEVQARVIAEQVAVAAVEQFVRTHPQTPKAEIPVPLKWAGGVITALLTVGVASLCMWVVSTLSNLQQTVTRIDTRQQINDGNVEGRLKQIEDRITRVEQERKGSGA
ncbi:MAG: hypothetical protein P0Y64_16885 [Candidatus Sphingomonas colombiensis]|nr:hypothetical protein [Sphingomonas sp.]WEK42996.1 MAG: hypothetical protein P0Y64_16885 [Sphingomonas sp.]